MKLANVDHLPGWHIAHLARRYSGMAADTHTRADDETRARWSEIADVCRAHPKHPRST